MKTKITGSFLFILFYGWLLAATPHQSQVQANVNLARFPIEMTAGWTFNYLIENKVLFDFSPGVCTIDSVRVNGTIASWNQSGNQLTVEVDAPGSPTVISFNWHATPYSQSDGIRKRDTEDTHSVTAVSTPFGPSLWMPIPTGTGSCITGSFSFVMPAEMDGVATGSRVSDTPVAEGHEVRFEIQNPVLPRHLFFAMASGREIESSTLITSAGNRPLIICPYPGLQEECDTDLAPIPTLVPMLEQWFGAFPDVSGHVFSACVMDFDQVVAAPGILALGQGFITGEGGLDKRLANGLSGQWWGYRFPVYDPTHVWVTEGLRTYSEILVAADEMTGSEESPVDLAADILKGYDLGGTTLEGRLVVPDGNPYDHPYVLTAKGAYTLHMLRAMLGDELFFRGLKQLSTLNSHASATNRLQFALEKETRLPLGAFLRQWTDRAPRPVLSYRFDQTGNRLVLDISQEGIPRQDRNLTLNSLGNDQNPAWSSDGARIAFESNRSGNLNIWVKSIETKNGKTLPADIKDENTPFRIPLQVVQGEEETTVWLTETAQRFFLPKTTGTPQLDPRCHTLKLAVSNCPALVAPNLEFSLSVNNTTYPFQLNPTFIQLPEGLKQWRIDGIPVSPASDGNLRVREPGTHTVQLTVSSDEQTAVSQILSVRIPQPDGDVSGNGSVDGADLAEVLRNSTADPIPNGIRDEADIAYLTHLLRNKIRDGDSITPTNCETGTDWEVELQAEPAIVTAGHAASVSLKIHGTANLQLAVIKLDFEPDKLEPVSVTPASGIQLLFSSVANGTWRLVLGCLDTGFDCSDSGGEIVSTIKFRALKDSGSATVETGDKTCIFPHVGDNALLPLPASAELSFSEGAIRFPLVLNTDKWETSLGLIETGNVTDEITLTALDNDGNTIATDSVTMAPWQRLVRKLADFFSDVSSIASVQITQHGAIRAWVEYRDRVNSAAAACPASTEAENQLLVPHVDEGNYWNTISGIVNCGNDSSPLTFSASDNEITVNENTPSGGGYHGRFINLLNESLLQGGWGMFDGNNMALAGAELFYRVDSLHQAAALRLSDKTALTFYFPHIDITGFWWTGISLINPGNESATIRMEAFDANGQALPDNGQTIGTTNFTLPAQTRRVDLVENFFGNRLDPKTAWIQVTSNQPLTGLEIFGSRSGVQEDLSAGLEAVSKPLVNMTFPWATDGENGQWCGLALLNPDETNPADNITVTLLTKDGTIVGLAALHLDSLQKHVVLIQNLFGGTVPTGGAYIRVQSDIPLVGFELTGSDNHQWLMGLNGM